MVPDRSGKKTRRSCWLRATGSTRYVTIRSRFGWFEGHWSNAHGGTVRCPGAECPICESGAEPRVFVYAFVELEHGEVVVFEFPERLRELVQEIDGSPTRGVGVQVAIRREGVHRNSPVSVLVTGFEAVEEVDVAPFVSTLGKPGWHLHQSESASETQRRKSS